ncbi:unnamed protein product [Symbiodinium sp. KB8]|nr:unnamed protein product [Symbiodinium sp. KB8]
MRAITGQSRSVSQIGEAGSASRHVVIDLSNDPGGAARRGTSPVPSPMPPPPFVASSPLRGWGAATPMTPCPPLSARDISRSTAAVRVHTPNGIASAVRVRQAHSPTPLMFARHAVSAVVGQTVGYPAAAGAAAAAATPPVRRGLFEYALASPRRLAPQEAYGATRPVAVFSPRHVAAVNGACRFQQVPTVTPPKHAPSTPPADGTGASGARTPAPPAPAPTPATPPQPSAPLPAQGQDEEPNQLVPGTQLQVGCLHLRCQELLGSGSYSTVWLAQVEKAQEGSDMPRSVALKDVFCRGEAALQQSLFEVQLLMAVERRAARAAQRGLPPQVPRLPRCLTYQVDASGSGWSVRMALTRLRGEQLDGWLQRSAEVSGESSQRPWTDALRGGCILARRLLQQLGPTLQNLVQCLAEESCGVMRHMCDKSSLAMAGMDKSYFLDGKPSTGAEVNQASHAGTELRQMLPSTTCVRVFVAGAVTHVGKTSVCLGLLAALRKAGLTAQELAYIKPATQCEAPDLLSKWCAKEGIEYVAGEEAPLVFYSGFTRSFLAGEQGTSAQWLQKIEERIQQMSHGKRVVIVDGVGFPAVGSIVGVDNADVARASRAPVLLVCKSGVGSAVDSFSLNSSYFLAKSVPVLGAVFNLAEIEGFYSWDKCRESIEAWFALQGGRRERFYGVVPKLPELDGLRERIKETGEEDLDALADMNAVHFAQHVDIAAIFADAAADPWCRGVRTNPQPAPTVRGGTFQPLSRDAVSATAKKAGAKGGG